MYIQLLRVSFSCLVLQLVAYIISNLRTVNTVRQCGSRNQQFQYRLPFHLLRLGYLHRLKVSFKILAIFEILIFYRFCSKLCFCCFSKQTKRILNSFFLSGSEKESLKSMKYLATFRSLYMRIVILWTFQVIL